MKGRLPTLLLIATTIGAATAGAHAEGLNLYGGVGLGSAEWHSGGTVADGDGGGITSQFYGGWQFHPNVAVEAGLVNLGHLRQNGLDSGTTHGLYLDAVGRYPLAPKWWALGRVGLADAKLKTVGDDDRSTALKLGVGVQYDMTGTTSLRLGYDHYRFSSAFDGKPEIGNLTAGVQIGF